MSDTNVEFPDEEWQLLVAFSESAKTLANTEFMRGELPDLCEINSDDVLVARTSLPASGIVREFLHVLRPFILSREPWSYERSLAY